MTGSGKTATMGFVIEKVQKPTLVLAHNKTLAAQLCSEFREFFPDNAVEYFVSYYDYYQPEAYVPHQDLYIEKDSSINDEIDRLRHAATAALFARKDVIIVASVSCIYGIGSPELYQEKMLLLKQGEWIDRDATLRKLVSMQYMPQRHEPRARQLPRARRGAGGPSRPTRRAPTACSSSATRSSGSSTSTRSPARSTTSLDHVSVWPATHYVTSDDIIERSLREIRHELRSACKWLRGERQGARGAPAAPAHRVRHGDAQGDGLLLGDRELLADPRRPAGRARRRTR